MRPLLNILKQLPTLILLFSVGQCAYSAEFGRLFSSAQQRETLDSLRQNNNSSSTHATEDTDQIKGLIQPKSLTPITVKGIVIRSNGPASVWTNSHKLKLLSPDGENPATNKYNQTPRVHMFIDVHGAAVEMKPGQSYLPSSQTIVEQYQFSSEQGNNTILKPDALRTNSNKTDSKNAVQVP